MRGATAGAGLVVLAFSLTACSGPDVPARQGGDLEDTVRVLYSEGDVRVFSPWWDDTPKFLVFDPLARYEAGKCSEVVGGLAESSERSEDWTRWTVRLREDARWHDGAPVTAHDITWNIRLWQDPEVGWYAGAPVDSAVALDDRTVRFYMKRPSRWPVEGWDVFYPRHLLEGLPREEFFDWDFWRRPVGSGPFRFVREMPQEMVELEANPDYHGGRPEIDRVIMLFGSGSPLTELRAGNVDIAGISALEAEALDGDPRFRLYYQMTRQTEWLVWNHRDPHFRDVRVRRALSHALDRREIARGMNLPEAYPITDGPFTHCLLSRGQLVPPRPHDTARARSLLEEAGWTDRDGDGIRERAGVPFRFTTIVSPRNRRLATFVQAQLRRVGIRMDVTLLELAAARDRFQQGDFQAAIPASAWAGTNVARYRSPVGVIDSALADLMARVDAEPDPLQQADLMERAARRYREVVPATFLHMRGGVLAVHRRIRGLGETGTVLDGVGWQWAYGGLPALWVERGTGDGP